MTPDELSALMRTTTWTRIGSGSFNTVYVSDKEFTIEGITQKWVKKIAITPNHGLSNTDRAVRKFKEINGLPAYKSKDNEWLAPFLGRTEPTDEQTAKAILDIYDHTGNLVVDACGKGNFLRSNTQSFCADVDLARRRGSVASENPKYWPWPRIYEYLDKFTFLFSRQKSITISVIRTLLWLEKCLSPEQIKKPYLSLEFIKKFHMICQLNIILTPELIDRVFDLPDNQFSHMVWNLDVMKGRGRALTQEDLISVLTEIDREAPLRAEMHANLQAARWVLLREDEENKVFISEENLNIYGRNHKWIKTESKKNNDKVHNSFRVVSKWNTLNPTTPAYSVTEDIWIAPDLGDTPASDKEIADALVRIFAETRNLIINAFKPGTFLVHEGQAKCVQVGYARKRDSLDNTIPKFWDSDGLEMQLEIWKTHPSHPKPLTTSIIQTMLYLDKSLLHKGPIKDEYITPSVLAKVRMLRLNEIKLTVSLMNALASISESTLRRLISKLIYLEEDNAIALEDEAMQALLKLVEIDVSDEILNENLFEFIQAQLSNAPAHKLIHLATECRLLNIIKSLVAEKPELLEIKEPECKKTPLIVAVLSSSPHRRDSSYDVIDYLIRQGVSLNEQIEPVEGHFLEGYTALDCANWINSQSLCDKLKAAGALSHLELHASASSIAGGDDKALISLRRSSTLDSLRDEPAPERIWDLSSVLGFFGSSGARSSSEPSAPPPPPPPPLPEESAGGGNRITP